MKEKFKSMLHSVCALALGLLFVLLSLLPYIAFINGYSLLNNGDIIGGGDFLNFCIAFFQFFHILAIFVLAGLGVFGIFEKLGIVEVKKSVKGWTYAKLIMLIQLIMVGLSLLVLLFTIIECARHSIYIGVGAIMNFILEGMALVGYYFLDKLGYLNNTYEREPKQEEVKEEPKPEGEEPASEEKPVEEPVSEEKVEEEKPEEVKVEVEDKKDASSDSDWE